MDGNLLIAVIAIVALLAGLAAGYWFGGRPASDLRGRLDAREGEVKANEERIKEMVRDLATMSERAAKADELQTALEGLREENTQFRAERAGFAEQKRLLEESRDKLLKEFENTGSKVLEAAREKFAAEASKRLGDAEVQNKEAVAGLLKPVSERLEKYEKQVSALEEKRTDAFGELKGLIDRMAKGQEDVRREAQRLGNSLTNAPKARGRWGERALQNLLEQCGLAQHTDFIMEHSVETEDGRLRPDAIINVPGQKKLVIDSKVSLNAYQAAFEADDEDNRDLKLKAHAKSMRSHVQTLGAKSYQSQFEEAPDYVIMFVPGEHFVTAALDADPELWDFAFERRVLLATPTNLVAIARTVAQVWRQDGLAKEAQEIGRMGAELYDRLRVASEHLKRVGGGLESAVKNYNKFVGSFERNVLSSGKRLAEKGVEIGKAEIEEVPLVESTPNYNAADAAQVDALEDKRDAAE